MTRSRIVAPLAMLALAVGLLAPTGTAQADPLPEPPPLAVPTIEWGPCEGFDAPAECATVPVPLDYDEPEGETVDLDLLRVTATGTPEQRLGTLFVNPGGPGGASRDFAAQFDDYVPAEVSAAYDVVGIDPRGVGPSAPMTCTKPGRKPSYPWESFPTNRRQVDARIAYDSWVREACTSGPAPIVNHMTTADTARDMDLMRQAVGDAALNYYGISYGTQLGSTYAAMFPATVGRMVLDGVLDPEEWTTGQGDGTTRPFSERLESGYGAWQSLTAAFAECDRVGKRRCVLAGSASQAWQEIIQRLRRKPFGKGDDRVTYEQVVSISLGYLYSADGVPWLMREIKGLHRAMFGKGALRAAAWRPMAVRRRIGDGPVLPGPYAFGTVGDAFTGVACADSDNPANERAWVKAGNRADRLSPWFGKFWTWASGGCASWPGVTKEDRFAGPFATTPAKPVLVVGNTYDPATPLHGARAVNRLLDGSRLLVMDGWGHGALGTGPCIDAAYRDYLVDGTLPATGTVCEPGRQLFPG